jgi:tRNA(Ile2) C34 agmatinyltransferase TiaS
MMCPKCQNKMKSQGTVDNNWRFYKCKCGYESAKHIHPKMIK